MTEIRATWSDPVQAGVSFANDVRPWCREKWAAGKRLVVSIQEEEDARSIQKNKEYWGYVLAPISEQAQIAGMGADAEGWHYYYKKMFLGYEFKKVKPPGARRPSITRTLRSTTGLSNKKMALYIEQVRAHAATTFGVAFPAMEDLR